MAYADFVTAMMALFIVLWLMGSSEPVKKAVAGYFRDPSGHSSQNGTGQSGITIKEDVGIGKDDMAKLKEKLESAIRQSPDVAKLKDQVQMTVTGEGLRIELLEKDTSTFFETGNAQPTDSGTEMLQLLSIATRQAPQPAFGRGPHRRAALCFAGRILQLGTLVRPGERGPEADPNEWRAREPGGRCSRVRRSAAEEAGRSQ